MEIPKPTRKGVCILCNLMTAVLECMQSYNLETLVLQTIFLCLYMPSLRHEHLRP